MGYHLLNILILLFLITYAPNVNCTTTISSTERSTIEYGLAAGTALAEVLADGNFADSLVKLGTKFAPFLSVLGPLAGLGLAFIPTGDSPELVFMRDQFEDVNVKLDIITSEFTKVKSAIDWSTVVVSYGTYERKIRAAVENLNRIYQVEKEIRKNEIENFVIQYESNFENSVQKLYDVIMNNGHVISKNILAAAIQQTKYHKREVEQFSLGLVQLLIQGIKVKVSYYGMKEWDADHVVTEWETKMNNLRDKLQTMSNDVKDHWLSQMQLDAAVLLLNHHGLGNQGLLDKLYNFITEKYDWRLWFVAVYDDMQGLDNHNMWTYGGICFLHKHKKNTIIASQDKTDASRFRKANAAKLLQRVEDGVVVNHCPGDFDRASTMVQRMIEIAGVGQSHIPHALRLALLSDHNLVYRSLDSHISVHEIDTSTGCCDSPFSCYHVAWNYIMIVFG